MTILSKDKSDDREVRRGDFWILRLGIVIVRGGEGGVEKRGLDWTDFDWSDWTKART